VAAPLIVASAQSVANAQPHSLGRLLGVFDDATGLPIADAEVVNLAAQTRVRTSVSGAASLAFLEPGLTVLQIRKIGYASRWQTVRVSPADTIPITLTLKPLAQQLPGVYTTASNMNGKLSSFERHREEGMGHFLTQEQLDKATGRLTSDVLRTLPGLKTTLGAGTAAYVGTTRGAISLRSGSCLAAVILDGAVVYSPGHGQTPFNINSIRPEEMAGVEFYAGGASMPIEYRFGCGLVVIWTR
jgi:hypothetical protein